MFSLSRDEEETLCRYANGDDAAIEDFRQILRKRNFMAYPPESNGIPWPIPVSEEKRNFRALAIIDREQASVLLHWLADPKSRSAEKGQVARILSEHSGHYMRDFGAWPGGPATVENAAQLEAVPKFAGHPIDVVCAWVADHLAYRGNVASVENGPIRACMFCRKLFVRHRKSKFCPGARCRTTFYNRRGVQRCDAFYQFKRRFLLVGQELTPERLKRLAKMRINAIQRGKLSAAEKGRRVRFLRGLIA
jgi:hypothetical protein